MRVDNHNVCGCVEMEASCRQTITPPSFHVSKSLPPPTGGHVLDCTFNTCVSCKKTSVASFIFGNPALQLRRYACVRGLRRGVEF